MSVICYGICEECNTSLDINLKKRMNSWNGPGNSLFTSMGFTDDNRLCDAIFDKYMYHFTTTFQDTQEPQGLQENLYLDKEFELTEIALKYIIEQILQNDHLHCFLLLIQNGLDIKKFDILSKWYYINRYLNEHNPKHKIKEYIIENQLYSEENKINYLYTIMKNNDSCRITGNCVVEEYQKFTPDVSNPFLKDRLMETALTYGHNNILQSMLDHSESTSTSTTSTNLYNKICIQQVGYSPEQFPSVDDYISYLFEKIDQGIGISIKFFMSMSVPGSFIPQEYRITIFDQVTNYLAIDPATMEIHTYNIQAHKIDPMRVKESIDEQLTNLYQTSLYDNLIIQHMIERGVKFYFSCFGKEIYGIKSPYLYLNGDIVMNNIYSQEDTIYYKY